MENLIQKGYTRKLTEEEAVRRSQRTCYFPHYGVFDPQKQYKIREVFDAASLHDGFSPNNQLLQGPDLPNSLLGILLRFRQYPVASVADTEGMFNKVKVPPENSDALRFLWWKDRGLERPSEFQMTSHIFVATQTRPVEQTFVYAMWILRSQPFLFKVREPHQPPTRRGILSAVRSLYYPMGFVCQVVLEAKKVLQRLRKLHLEWNDLIPEDLQSL